MMIGTRDRARSSRQTSNPEPSGSITSRSTRSGLTRSASASDSPAVPDTAVSSGRLAAIAKPKRPPRSTGPRRVEALATEGFDERGGDGLLVLDEENGASSELHFRGFYPNSPECAL